MIKYRDKSNRNPLHDVPRDLFLPPVVKPGRSRVRMPCQLLHVLVRKPCRTRSAFAVTRNERGDSRDCNPTSFNRRLTRSQVRFEVVAVPDYFCVRPLRIRNNGDPLASPAIPAASTYASIKPSRSCRTGMSLDFPPFSRNRSAYRCRSCGESPIRSLATTPALEAVWASAARIARSRRPTTCWYHWT
jgi:hypothetical protein